MILLVQIAEFWNMAGESVTKREISPLKLYAPFT